MQNKIAFISTGGTISSLGEGRFDLLDYNKRELRVEADQVLAHTQIDKDFPEVEPIAFRAIDSTAISGTDWADLAELCIKTAQDPDLGGIVIGHGTASLEETAWMLSLVLDLNIPVVLTGSMRPLTGISTDADANLAAAIRVAQQVQDAPDVYVVFNEELHAPRHVTKSHTLRLGAFQSPWAGPIGHVNGTVVHRFGQASVTGLQKFDPTLLRNLPRVDICYSHIGADRVAIDAFVQAGAKGIISAGFGPGDGTPEQNQALIDAVEAGVVVVQSTRCGAGLAVDSDRNQKRGIISGNDLAPVKARILLALCLARGDGHAQIKSVFAAL